MRTYTWEEYYEKFFDWAESTARTNFSYLTEFGPEDEVFDVLGYIDDDAFRKRFASKALARGVRFLPEHVEEISGLLDEETLSKMADLADGDFNSEQLNNLYLLVDNEIFERISKRAGFGIFGDEEEFDDAGDEEEVYSAPVPPKKKKGFLDRLRAVIGTDSEFSPTSYGAANNRADGARRQKRHDGTCDGNCASCPPHYGYRYGRWYYGRGHHFGCEFGGNKDDGSNW